MFLGRKAQAASASSAGGDRRGRAELAVGHRARRAALLAQRHLHRGPRRRRAAQVRMGFFDGVFESASGFTGTGATVLTDLEDPELRPPGDPLLAERDPLPRRPGHHGPVRGHPGAGLGRQGADADRDARPQRRKAPTPARQQAAWVFAAIFIGLTTVLTVLLWRRRACQLVRRPVPRLRHHRHRRLQHLQQRASSTSTACGIEMTITLFMFLACTNFTLLYYLVLLRSPASCWPTSSSAPTSDHRWRVTALVVGFGLYSRRFRPTSPTPSATACSRSTSIMTNTGFGTANFDRWNDFSRGLLLVLMFIGGCAGSTSCSVKVIRYILLFKILRLEMEQVFHPSVVRHVRLGGKPRRRPRACANDVLRLLRRDPADLRRRLDAPGGLRARQHLDRRRAGRRGRS